MTKQMLLGDCFEVERNISRVGKTVKKSDRFDTEPTFSNSATRKVDKEGAKINERWRHLKTKNINKSRSISLGLIHGRCSCFVVFKPLMKLSVVLQQLGRRNP